jgi:exodeoxyribonuclease V beta subunit
MRLTLDLGSDDHLKNRLLSERETLAENLRLVYVAMTRAKHRCYFVWGRFNDTETSAPAYLFHGSRVLQNTPDDDVVSKTAGYLEKLTDAHMLEDLERLVEKASGTITLRPFPSGEPETVAKADQDAATLRCRTFSGKIDRSWRISSFSSLVSGKIHRGDHGDDAQWEPSTILEDNTSGDSSDASTVGSFFSFPKGTLAGTFVHSVFENMDFAQAASPALEQLVAEKLGMYGFDENWTDATCAMVRKVLSVPLEKNDPKFTLSRIGTTDRINELSFYFPLKRVSPQDLQDFFERENLAFYDRDLQEVWQGLTFSPTRGFVKGFIDMVFHHEGRYYLVDWKSNYLGGSVQDYHQKALAAAMADACYFLQYLLYTVALHAYLRLRLPGYRYEKHFGAIYYLFVRGMDDRVGCQYGVFRDRPDEGCVERLCALLIDT